jgi:hypothetical protein
MSTLKFVKLAEKGLDRPYVRMVQYPYLHSRCRGLVWPESTPRSRATCPNPESPGVIGRGFIIWEQPTNV